MSSGSGRASTRVVSAMQTMEGDGMDVMRPFPAGTLSYVDPFLLLDRLGPVTFAPGAAKGIPPHPHRGFEAITYLLSGRLAHRDSFGGSGTLAAGDVQWMRAGSGLVHSEMPDEEFRSRGGTLHAVQLWLNLPRRDKMLPPEYRDVPAAAIPSVPAAGARVKVISGRAFGAESTLGTKIPLTYLHAKIERGQSLVVLLAPGDAALVYALDGSGFAGSDRRAVGPNQLVTFDPDGDRLELHAGASGLDAIVLAAHPLGEPVSRHGPFVMNTPQEVQDAIDDYRAGKMGTL